MEKCNEPYCDSEATHNWNGIKVCIEHYFMYAEWEDACLRAANA